jgi:aerobic carbon-monoxide dehydrogenase small subunit
MRRLTIEINGRAVNAEIEPRTHLADFLRGAQFLTATHIGCEHGVCGACTILIDGAPARSCITYAGACEGARVTTLEGLELDPIMVDLREAFSTNHALQCGYCTPGMLVSCRDIIMRLPDADEARIRRELSGNLCRCTGYVGIVAAVQQVLLKYRDAPVNHADGRSKLGPVGGHPPKEQNVRQARKATRSDAVTAGAAEAVRPEQWAAVNKDGVEILQSFSVAHPREKVWDFFDDLDQVARCMPGARLTKKPVQGVAEGVVNVKLGPIVSSFAGVVEVERDPTNFSGVARGAGRDFKSNSNARALISYKLASISAQSTRVDISVKFLLTGAFAQFSRSGLAKDVADQLTQMFAKNLERSLSGAPIADGKNQTLSAAAVARSIVRSRFRSLFEALFGKSSPRN